MIHKKGVGMIILENVHPWTSMKQKLSGSWTCAPCGN